VQRPLRVRGRAGRRDLRGKINGHLSFEKLSDLVRVGPVPSALEACHAGWTRLEPSLKKRRPTPADREVSTPRPRGSRHALCERRGSGLFERGEDILQNSAFSDCGCAVYVRLNTHCVFAISRRKISQKSDVSFGSLH
jgi:hypothetical protein